MPSIDVGAEVFRNRALNCWPWVRSLIHSPDAVIHSPAEIVAAWPTTVTRSRCPRAFARRTQKPFSALWKVTRSTRPASTSWVDDSRLRLHTDFSDLSTRRTHTQGISKPPTKCAAFGADPALGSDREPPDAAALSLAVISGGSYSPSWQAPMCVWNRSYWAPRVETSDPSPIPHATAAPESVLVTFGAPVDSPPWPGLHDWVIRASYASSCDPRGVSRSKDRKILLRSG